MAWLYGAYDGCVMRNFYYALRMMNFDLQSIITDCNL